MTRDDTIRLAREADLLDFRDEEGCIPEGYLDALQKFVGLVAKEVHPDVAIAEAFRCGYEQGIKHATEALK